MVVLLAIILSTLLHWSAVWDGTPRALEPDESVVPAVVALAGSKRAPMESAPLEVVTSDGALLAATAEERLRPG